MNVRDNDVTVTFTVHVPAGVRFVGRTVNGEITADGAVAAGLRCRPSTATSTFCDLVVRRRARPSTDRSTVRSAAPTGPSARLQIGQRQLTLDLPADASADLQATTVNGSISTDFPITVDRRVNLRQLRGHDRRRRPYRMDRDRQRQCDAETHVARRDDIVAEWKESSRRGAASSPDTSPRSRSKSPANARCAARAAMPTATNISAAKSRCGKSATTRARS